MDEPLTCWRCGAPLDARTPLPLARLAHCRDCGVDLHTCRMCRHHAPRYTSGCDHEHAEGEPDAKTANFCKYFVPRPAAHLGHEPASTTASALDTLFGGSDASTTGKADTPDALRNLFGDDD